MPSLAIPAEAAARKLSVNKQLVLLSPKEALYFNLLRRNRGIVVFNDVAFEVLWSGVPHSAALVARLNVLASGLSKKVPGVIFPVRGAGRYIPRNSGIEIGRLARERELALYVAVRSGYPIEPGIAPTDWA